MGILGKLRISDTYILKYFVFSKEAAAAEEAIDEVVVATPVPSALAISDFVDFEHEPQADKNDKEEIPLRELKTNHSSLNPGLQEEHKHQHSHCHHHRGHHHHNHRKRKKACRSGGSNPDHRSSQKSQNPHLCAEEMENPDLITCDVSDEQML